MKWYITGDLHGSFGMLYRLPEDIRCNPGVGVIILGDAGWNFFLNKTDVHHKKEFHDNCAFTVYCVRGNHEARPQSIKGMEAIWDSNVNGEVYCEPDYPRIRYFFDYGHYNIGGLNTLVIGGAYSVDKGYRLARAGIIDEKDNNPKKTGWWANEQLSAGERAMAMIIAEHWEWDLILTHTCPKSWQPTDLFLSSVDQDSVDSTMEEWMEVCIKQNPKVKWYMWMFGHYHDDRLVRPHVEMFYRDFESLDEAIARWKYWDKHNELDKWWYNKDPNFYTET